MSLNLVLEFNFKGLQLRTPSSDDGHESWKGLVGWKWERDCQFLKVLVQDGIQDCKYIKDVYLTEMVLPFLCPSIERLEFERFIVLV